MIREQLKKNKIILAPLAGISSFPFRMFNRQFGCEFAFSEMINVRSLSYLNKRTRQIIFSNAEDRPLGMQILGQDPYYILKALTILKDYEFDILDLNAGCPQRKIVNRGEGAALLKNPRTLHHLLKLIVKHSDVPVTVKMRLGWDKPSTAADIALYAQDAGIAALCVHGRTKMQGYTGEVDYEAIRSVKEALDIPVIASGDIFSAQLAKEMLDKTGCDGVMVARGALGNPWIFKEIDELLNNGRVASSPCIEDSIRAMKTQLDHYSDFYEEKLGIKQFRKFFIWYTRGFPNVKYLRAKVGKIETNDEMIGLIEEFHMQAQRDPL
ncbi:MAG: tRNA dihydrouridine synthase DusB [bacterium]